MDFEKGRIVVNGNYALMRELVHVLSAKFYHEGKRVLIVDSMNSLNPYHPVFKNEFQRQYFQHIYCVRTPMPYDLWARLSTSSGFIKNKKIDVLILTSLSLIFRDGLRSEVRPMIKNILKVLDILTKKNELMTIIGNCESRDDVASLAFDIVSKEKTKEVFDGTYSTPNALGSL